MKKKYLAAALAAVLVLSLAACGSGTSQQTDADSAEQQTDTESAAESSDAAVEQTGETSGELKEITLVLDWTPNTNHTGFYVADAEGYYEEAGLKVNIIQPPEDGAVMMVASGNAEFCVDFQDYLAPVFASEDTYPVVAVAAMIQHNTSGIISLKEDGIDTPKGLEGKNYATWELPVEQAMIQNIVEADGGDYSKVNLIPEYITDVVSALQQDIDAVWIYYAWDGIACERAGLDTNMIYFSDITPEFDYYSPVIVANTDFLAEDPDTAKAFLAATAKGYAYAEENPESAAEILCKAVPELDPEMVAESQKWLADQYTADAPRWGYIDAARWDAFYGWLYENGLSEEIPAGTGFTNDYLPE